MPLSPDHMGAAPLASASTAPSSAPTGHDTMRRLQIGIGGVLIILLLVAMAGLASDRARENVQGAAVSAQDMMSAGGVNNAPLEELGVQPVSKDGAAPKSNVAQPLPSDDGQMMANSGRGSVPDLEPDPELERVRQLKP
jgi:hypothetical protein